MGIIGSDDVQIVNGTPTFDTKKIGENKVISYSPFTATGAHAQNYAVTQPNETTADISKKELTVAPFEVAEKSYDGKNNAEFVAPPKLIGVADSDKVALEGGKLTVETIDVGTVNVTVGEFNIVGADIENYTFVQPKLTDFKTKIIPKVITITPDANQSKTFSMTDPVFTFTHARLVGNDVLGGKITRLQGENAGAYPFLIGNLTAGKNYKPEIANGNFTIKKTTGTVDLTAAKSKATPVDIQITATVSGSDGVVDFYILGEKITTSKVVDGIAKARFKPLSVGTYKVSAILRSSTNYKDTMSDDAFFNVTADDLKPPKVAIPFIKLEKSASTIIENTDKNDSAAGKIRLPKGGNNNPTFPKKPSPTHGTSSEATMETADDFSVDTDENILTDQPVSFTVDPKNEANLRCSGLTERQRCSRSKVPMRTFHSAQTALDILLF